MSDKCETKKGKNLGKVVKKEKKDHNGSEEQLTKFKKSGYFLY